MIAIGRFHFNTKAAAERHIRELLCGHVPGCPIDGIDREFVYALIDAHPRKAVIVGCGIRYVFVQDARLARGLRGDERRFCVCHIDAQESLRDFSWRPVLFPRTNAKRLVSVCRGLIDDQIESYRLQQVSLIPCAHCSRPLTRKDAHIDHAPPQTFAALLKGWLHSVRMEPDDIELIDDPGYEKATRFQDVFLAEQWREYHEINARLRCLCQRCNLSDTRKKNA